MTPHPLMKAYGLDAVPFDDSRMDQWRDSLHAGVCYLHEPTNLMITGGVDDIWIDPRGELIVVDYKATASRPDKPAANTNLLEVALRKLPPDCLPEVLRYIEFLEYKVTMASPAAAEDQMLWAAVEANQ